MADPRFYRNRGPLTLAAICAKVGIGLPPHADGSALVRDLASLDGAAPAHLSFFSGDSAEAFARSRAGFCLVPQGQKHAAPDGMTLLPCASVPDAVAAIALLFYPDAPRPPAPGVDPTGLMGREVVLGPAVAVGANAEIGDRANIGANTIIGPGVTIGQGCEIGDAVSISHAHIGDRVVIQPGAQIGQSSGAVALGRVIIQDGVEVGAASIVQRGTLNDTMIGEGSRIDPKIRIGPDARIGRRCAVSVPLGPGGQIADFGNIEDSGGIPAKPI